MICLGSRVQRGLVLLSSSCSVLSSLTFFLGLLSFLASSSSTSSILAFFSASSAVSSLLLLLLDLDLDLLGDDELDGVGDELRVLLDDLADALVLEVLLLVLLEEEAHLGTAADGGLTVSWVMVKVPPAADSQMYCSSSLFLVMICTFSATR